jgi:acetylornithine deacetylase
MNEGEPVHLAISYDEEVGCVGVRGLLKDLEERGLKPRGCIIGEPSGMEVVVGHKAGHAFTCTVTGRAAHAALAPFGVNAIEYAARLIVRLREIADRLALDETRHPGFEVPYSTITTGVIQGGVAGNIVPKDCRFRFGVRALPWTDPAAIVAEIEQYSRDVLLPRMRDVAPESDIVIEQTGEVPAMDLNEDAPLVRYAQRLSGSSRRPGYIGLGSEGGLFQRAGIPAVICGPGSIDQAHKPNEFVTLEQLALCERFILEVTRRPPGPQCEAV